MTEEELAGVIRPTTRGRAGIVSVHLMLVKRGERGEHEGWVRDGQFVNGSHKYFARKVLPNLPQESVRDPPDGGPYSDFDWLTRPADFGAWRAVIRMDPQLAESNLLMLVDILEREPDYWLYVSQ